MFVRVLAASRVQNSKMSPVTMPKNTLLHFYRAMHFSANARYWDGMSSVRPSVRLSVCDVGDL